MDGDRTKRVTTAKMVVYDDGPNSGRAWSGHPLTHGSSVFEEGDVIGYREANVPLTYALSGPQKGLPEGGCGLVVEVPQGETFPPSDYVDAQGEGRLWWVDCCDSDNYLWNAPHAPDENVNGRVYQATTPDWDDETTWPEAFPPREWGWDTECRALPAQRIRSGTMGGVVTSLGMLTGMLMVGTSVVLIAREWTMWAAEGSKSR